MTGIRVNTNVDALVAMRNLGVTATLFTKSVERLSSGMRINRAADDAAGLSISEKMRAQIRGTDQAARNAQDAISMIQTAEGALGEVHSMLQRMRELAVQYANDTLTVEDRNAITTELNQLAAEIDSISERTTFNGQFLLQGALDGLATALGVSTSSEIEVGSFDANVIVTGITVTPALVPGEPDDASTYFFSYDAATDTVTVTRQSDGATATALTTGVVTAGTSGTMTFDFATGADIDLDLEGLAGFTDDDDVGTFLTAAATNSLTTVLTGGNNTAQFQVGPASADTMTVSFEEVTTNTMSFDISALDPSNSSSAAAFIDAVDDDIQTISNTRATLGASQNRLEHAIANLEAGAENLTASESRIRNADIARETVNFGRAQILQQAGVAVLAQANAAPQSVLALLR